ncbi:magnesium/cobalt transporter CorA [Actimicrobium sp. CCC2.4]|uniref:magnesium/cobalt transporter CorA n=1 Tax=Actimicrobium sp. CCC2.4 TaxID=3048606 RepID=UPI002AC9699D|nr:magnesium/cobalt transporter CorA [Actimicrobium sp. CCC2.4]MEB0135157.1 magnesium/cobalt transporter CorA [Actimicrobium sp. CCC2.4]WPX30955.1 magnesium/cobalt transporter CorA [Actimicrobium sp. CCC2.4]
MLINCVAYQEGKKLRDVPVEDISEHIKIPDCMVWVALKEAEPAELEQMRHEFGLHELAVEDALSGHQRPKIEEYGDSLFAVMHSIELVEGKLHVGEVDVFVGENYVLSTRSRSQLGFLGVRERCEREPHQLKQGPAFVLYALMDAVVDRYFPVLEALEAELETIEENIFIKGAQRANVERLYELKRKVVTLRHAVAPLMEAVGKLDGGRVPPICVNSKEYFRDVHDHLSRINMSIDAIRDTIGIAIQVNLAMVSIDESEVNKRLAGWAAIFAVATAFFGVWGMNFQHMPELQWTYGYPVALAIVATVCGYLYYRFKKSGWL